MKQKATFQRSGTYLSSEIVATIVKMSLIFSFDCLITFIVAARGKKVASLQLLTSLMLAELSSTSTLEKDRVLDKRGE